MIKDKGKTVLFVGSFPDPITGQSLANKKAWEGYPYRKYKIENNVRITNSSLKILNPFLIGLKYCGLILRAFYILVKKRPDLVYISISRTINGSFKDLPVIILSRVLRIPVVCHLHGADFITFFRSIPNFAKQFYELFYSNVASYIVLTEGMKREVITALNNKVKVYVLSNFYESILDRASEQELVAYKSDKLEITFLSNLLYSKGIIHLIDAFIKIQEQLNLSLQLNIAGKVMSDSYMTAQKMTALLKEKTFGRDDIKFYGVLKGIEKYELLYRTNVFVLPTFYPTEAQPLSILEAMRMGCFIITTNHNYIGEMVDTRNGEIIQTESVDAIVKAIKSYIQLSSEQITRNISYNVLHARKFYSLHKFQKGLTSLLQLIE